MASFLYSIPDAPPLRITGITTSGGNVTINWNGTGPNGMAVVGCKKVRA